MKGVFEMRKHYLIVTAILLLSSVCTGAAQDSSSVAAQNSSFVNVNGTSLKDRQEAAAAAARARSKQARFWTAYSFDVRSGFAYQADGAAKGRDGGTYTGPAARGSGAETGNLAVFSLHEPDGRSVVSVGLQNLDRQNDYGGLTVYWLGRAGTEESLGYLRGLLEAGPANRASESAAQAVAMHDGPLAGRVLTDLIRNSTAAGVKLKAVQWLSLIGEGRHFFLELVRNDQEDTEVRKQAVLALGVWGRGAPVLGELAPAYDAITNREVRERILLVAHMGEGDDALRLLTHVADADTDPVTRKRALLYISQKPGPRAFEYMRESLNRTDSSPEIQRATLMAISQRPRDEAVPVLIEVARTHPDRELRNQARFWLQRVDDERAREFLRQTPQADAR
jgi:HEAT repeat protein